VAGPLGATFVTLVQLGWTPVGPDAFKDPIGNVWCGDGAGGRNREFERAARESARKQQWVHAAKHYCGHGLEEGGDFTAARKLRIKLMRATKLEVGILDSIVTGGCWFGDRFQQANAELEGKCSRCGLHETAYHAYYGCSDNPNAGKWIAKTQYWATQAQEALPCLWVRGIVPKVSSHFRWMEMASGGFCGNLAT